MAMSIDERNEVYRAIVLLTTVVAKYPAEENLVFAIARLSALYDPKAARTWDGVNGGPR